MNLRRSCNQIATLAVISIGLIAVANIFPASTNQITAQDRKPGGEEDKADTASEDDATKKLTQARVDAAHKAYSVAAELAQQGKSGASTEAVYTWSVRWLNAQRDLSSKPEDHRSALTEHLKRIQDHAKVVKALWEAGGIGASPLDVAASDFYLIEAELWLAQAKAAPK